MIQQWPPSPDPRDHLLMGRIFPPCSAEVIHRSARLCVCGCVCLRVGEEVGAGQFLTSLSLGPDYKMEVIIIVHLSSEFTGGQLWCPVN